MEGKKLKGRGKKRKARNQDLTSDSEEILCTQSKVIPSFAKRKVTKKLQIEVKSEDCGLRKEIDQEREGKGTGTDEAKIDNNSRNQDVSSNDKPDNVQVQPPETSKGNKSADDQNSGTEFGNYLNLNDETYCKVSASETKTNVIPVEKCSTAKRMENIQQFPTWSEDENISLKTDILISNAESACAESVVPPPPPDKMSEQLNLFLYDVNSVDYVPPTDVMENIKSSKHTEESVCINVDGNNAPVSNTGIPQAEQEFAKLSAVNQDLDQKKVSYVSEHIQGEDTNLSIPKAGSQRSPSMEAPKKRECFSLDDDNETPQDCYGVTGIADNITNPEKAEQCGQAKTSGNVTTEKGNAELGSDGLEREHKSGQESLQGKKEINLADNNEIVKFPGESSDFTSVSTPSVETDVAVKDTEKQQNMSPAAITEQNGISPPQCKTDPVDAEELTKGPVYTSDADNDIDTDMDITDSQLCEAVNADESSNQVGALQEVQKRHLEGRKIIHDLIVDLSYLNKLLLRTKREIEIARRKRLPASGLTKVKSNGHGYDQRRF